MKELKDFLYKNVIIIDTNEKEWKGYVESYDGNDSFLDYEGASIDVYINGSPDNVVCFGISEIKSIKTA